MRKICFMVFLIVLPIFARAQYIDAYQYGYQLGIQLAEQQAEQNRKAYNYGKSLSYIRQSMAYLIGGHYTEARNLLEQACDLENYDAAVYLGKLYEIGIGVTRNTDVADMYYQLGALNNNFECRLQLGRISRIGYYTSSHKDVFLNNIKETYAELTGGYANPCYSGGTPSYNYNNGNNMPSSSSSSSSTYSTCRNCGGAGVCTSCHGKGGSYQDTGYYTGSGNKSWISCGSCNGSGRCFICHGTGRQ